MFCPNCGSSEQSAKTYCRKCGKWIGSAPPEERLMVMIVFNGLSALFGLISAIALFSTYLGGTTAKWSVYLAATFCTIISVYQTLSFFFALNLRRRMREGQSFDVIEFRESPDRAELPPPDNSQFVPVGSVTENTTELLERKH